MARRGEGISFRLYVVSYSKQDYCKFMKMQLF